MLMMDEHSVFFAMTSSSYYIDLWLRNLRLANAGGLCNYPCGLAWHPVLRCDYYYSIYNYSYNHNHYCYLDVIIAAVLPDTRYLDVIIIIIKL